MKKTIKYVVVACIMIAGMGLKAQKLGHVNSQVIMQELPDYESARKDLESFNSDLTKELEMYQKLIVEFAQDYEQNKNGMSEDTRKRKETDLMERQQNYEKKAYEAQTSLQQKEQELLQQIMIKVNTAVKEVAEKEGYDYVYEVTTLLYAGGEDISDKVRKKLGITVAGK
ncbi:OmpH family outer membrane protein [Bacteroidota bacterium]|nr:OmpH family outer membrane protein [Bacteroidota bacterium]